MVNSHCVEFYFHSSTNRMNWCWRYDGIIMIPRVFNTFRYIERKATSINCRTNRSSSSKAHATNRKIVSRCISPGVTFIHVNHSFNVDTRIKTNRTINVFSGIIISFGIASIDGKNRKEYTMANRHGNSKEYTTRPFNRMTTKMKWGFVCSGRCRSRNQFSNPSKDNWRNNYSIITLFHWIIIYIWATNRTFILIH